MPLKQQNKHELTSTLVRISNTSNRFQIQMKLEEKIDWWLSFTMMGEGFMTYNHETHPHHNK